MIQIKKPCDGYVYIVKCDQCGGKWMQSEREHDHERVLCPNCGPRSNVDVKLGRVYIPDCDVSICNDCRSRDHCEHAKCVSVARNKTPFDEWYSVDNGIYPRSCADFLPDSISLPTVVRLADEEDV